MTVSVCALIQTDRLPLSDSESFPPARNKKTKSLIESLNHHEASKTHTQTQNFETKPGKSSHHRSNRRRHGILRRRPLRHRRPPRNGRSFPPSESSQRSINNSKQKYFVFFSTIDRCFVLIETRKIVATHTHTCTHTSTQRNKPQTYASLQFSFHFAISI